MAKLTPAAAVPDPQIIDPSLEADFFFEENKGKILTFIVVALLALGGWIFYQYHEGQTRSEQAAVFYAAKTTNDWKAIIAKYPGTIIAGNAQLLLADKLRDENKLDDAIALLSDFTKNAPTHPLIAQGWLSYAGTLEMKGDLPKATQTYANIAVQFGSTEAAPAALSAQARLVKKAGDAKKAREIYENIVQRFPASIEAQEAQQELGKLAD
ncbi:MAG: tetratricopeptide repeat protein [Chthoniobacterales bacterium]